MIMLYYMFATPIFLAFMLAEWKDFYSGHMSDNGLIYAFVIDMVFTVFMVVDIILNSTVFAFEIISHTGLKLTITDRGKIWANYRSSYFVPDLICTIPFHLICFGTNWITFQGLQIFRMSKIRQVGRYGDNLIKVLDKFFDYQGTSTTKRFVKLLFMIMFFMHLAGCGFYLIGYLEINYLLVDEHTNNSTAKIVDDLHHRFLAPGAAVSGNSSSK
jgi:hypothetical protein